MPKADRVHSTPPTSTPIADDPVNAATYRTPLREYIIEGAAVVFILLSAGVTSCLIAAHLEGKIAAQCAVSLQKAVQ
jgi:hypothetical protein